MKNDFYGNWLKHAMETRHGLLECWWPPSESNRAPTDYESAALTKHELEGHVRFVLRYSREF